MNARAAKKEAKERDGWECQFCGVTNEQHKEEYGRELHAHHIIKSIDGGSDDPENLITVCESCHQTIESTQADAIQSIVDDHESEIEELRNDYDREVASLRGELEENKRIIKQLLYNGIDDILSQYIKTDVYIVHSGNMGSSELLYFGRDEEKAFDEFVGSGGNATMVSKTVRHGKVLEIIDEGEIESEIIHDRIVGDRKESRGDRWHFSKKDCPNCDSEVVKHGEIYDCPYCEWWGVEGVDMV